MTTSVLIPAYNGWEYLAANLPAVLGIGADEVVVVDDASTDGTAQNISAEFPFVKLITHRRNCRFPITVNEGFKACTGEIVILINQDVTPDKHLIKNTLPFFASPEVFAVTFNEEHNSYAKAELIDGFLHYSNGPLSSSPHTSFWASGGSAAFRKSTWDELGGFDTIFTPGYYEDLDIGWRARRRGYISIWSPKAKVNHIRETAFKKAFTPAELTRIKERNYLFCHWKNLNTGNLVFHFRSLFLRCLRQPGFARPLVMALPQLLHIIKFRRQEKTLITKTDYEVFSV